ncbi:MAG: PilZ domain-containing protein [Phycisphaerales bacterium]|nr:PilZ domain-containing protein [Phycisphaerales bacterium]
MVNEGARPMWVEAMSEIAARYGLTTDGAHRPRPTRFILRGCAGIAGRGGSEETFPIDVTDVSIKGIGFLTRHAVLPGEQLTVAFESDPFGRSWTVKVIWADEEDDDRTRVGTVIVPRA